MPSSLSYAGAAAVLFYVSTASSLTTPTAGRKLDSFLNVKRINATLTACKRNHAGQTTDSATDHDKCFAYFKRGLRKIPWCNDRNGEYEFLQSGGDINDARFVEMGGSAKVGLEERDDGRARTNVYVVLFLSQSEIASMAGSTLLYPALLSYALPWPFALLYLALPYLARFCRALPCSTVLCPALPCSALLCSNLLSSALFCPAVLSSLLLSFPLLSSPFLCPALLVPSSRAVLTAPTVHPLRKGHLQAGHRHAARCAPRL